MADVYPAQGIGAPAPSTFPADAIAVIVYTLQDGDRGSGASERTGDFSLVAFVFGADTLREARTAAAEWLGLRKTALMCTKVGGNAAKLEVIEQEQPPPPDRTARDFDPAVDESDATI